MKRLICCFTVLLMVICSFSSAYAMEIPQQATRASEYDSIKYYSTLSDDEMASLGYSIKEISAITEYKKDFAQNLIRYSQMSSSELYKMGFSDTQVKAFELLRAKHVALKENPSNQEINSFLNDNVSRAVTASVTMNVVKSSSSSGKNTFKATWSWSGRPVVVGFHDTVAFGWTNGHTLTSYNNLRVTLKCDSTNNPTYTVPNSDKDTNIPDQAVRFKFPTASSGGWLYNQGTCYLTLNNDDNKSSTTMSWKYAHGTVQIVGFGISISGGSLSISLGSTQMANGLKQFTGLQ